MQLCLEIEIERVCVTHKRRHTNSYIAHTCYLDCETLCTLFWVRLEILINLNGFWRRQYNHKHLYLNIQCRLRSLCNTIRKTASSASVCSGTSATEPHLLYCLATIYLIQLMSITNIPNTRLKQLSTINCDT